jgi:RND family efflux transporter MFP subunit
MIFNRLKLKLPHAPATILMVGLCVFSIACPAQAMDTNSGGVSVVLAARHEAVLSAETDANVQLIFKEFGQEFKKGAKLVQLNPTTTNLNVRRTKAVVAEAQKAFTILQDLYETKSVSILELENARSELAVAEVDLAIARQEYSRCFVNAPCSGRVRKVLVHEHEWVKKGDPILEIVDDSVLLAKFLLPSSLFGQIKLGDNVIATIQENGKSYSGTISHIGAVMDPSSRSFEVYAEIPNTESFLRCGMRGILQMQTP